MASENREYNKVVEYIKKLLTEGELSAGDKLPTERAIAETLDTSRNSIREALRTLENMGVIESIQGSGNYLVGNITKPIADSLTMMLLMKKTNQMEVSQLRRYMDLLAFNIAFDTHSNIDLTELTEILHKMENASIQDKIYFDTEFHYRIFAASGNQLMISLMNALSEIYEGSIRFVLTTADSNIQDYFVKVHRDICQSFADKNRSLGIEAINEHYDIIENKLLSRGI